ncbi:MAG: hypothetical protein FWF59_06190 [Turicibacter sp.]|nr:hypothetical protein [Turicibacter sp.]
MKNYKKAFALLAAFIVSLGVWNSLIISVGATEQMARNNVSRLDRYGIDCVRVGTNSTNVSCHGWATGTHVSGNAGTTVGIRIHNETVSTQRPLASRFIWSGTTTVSTLSTPAPGLNSVWISQRFAAPGH